MFVNIGFHLQFAMQDIINPNILHNLAAKIRNKKENTKKFINFF